MRIRLLAVCTTALLVLAGACGDDDVADTTTTTAAPSSPDDTPATDPGLDDMYGDGGAPGTETGDATGEDTAGDGTTVEANGLSFSPRTVEITAGDSITWVNTGDLPHTVTSTDGPVDFGESLGAGDEVTITFDSPGTYEYECTIHPGMTGTIVVS